MSTTTTGRNRKDRDKDKEPPEDSKKEENEEKVLRGPSKKIFIVSQAIPKQEALVPIKHSIKTTQSKLKDEKYIISENYVKLNYDDLNPTKEEMYTMMRGMYSSLRPGIAYINPKPNEPHELIEGRPPRKVVIDRMKKIYATWNIESLLKQLNIDFSQMDPLETWLPLEFFEDKDLDIFTAKEWMQLASDKEKGPLYIQGVGLHRDNEGRGTWKRVLINHYDEKGEKYEGIWDETAENPEKCALSKIYLLFDSENPFLFCQKISLASIEREKAESIIRYNLYIDRMVQGNLPDINDDIKKRLLKNIEKLSYLKMEQKNIDELIKELSNNYIRTTNKIIFDKFYYSNHSNILIIDNLKLPPHIINNPDIRIQIVKSKGLEPIPPYNYITSYKDFTFKTLLCKKEIIDCLQKIKEECNKIKNNNCIFKYEISRPLRLQEFKSMQKNQITAIGKKLDDWVKTIKDTLEKSLTGVGKGSFNLNVASKEIYEYLKLKKYMTVVKCLMQDVLYSLVTSSMKSYVEFFQSYIPEKVEVKDVNDVRNIFKEEKEKEELNTTLDLINVDDKENKDKKDNIESTNDEEDYIVEDDIYPSLFQINITKKDDKKIEYTTKEEDLIKDINQLFDDGLERMQKIPQVEPLLLPNLIKAGKNGIPLKSITRPKGGKPDPKTKAEIKEGFELNEDAIWICEQYEELGNSLKKACEPLKPYLNTFNKYKDLIALDPSERMREIRNEEEDDKGKDINDDEDDENAWTNQKIKADIIENKRKEEMILREIPKIIHVSFFLINCKEYRNDLANKFNKLADQEVEFLREKAMEINSSIINGFAQMTKEITREVNTINDLQEVQAYIDGTLPVELPRLKKQTDKANEIYSILDEFQVKLQPSQFEFRMSLMRGPTDIENTVKEKRIQLEKKKDQLAQEQIDSVNELKDAINGIESNIKELATYNTEGKTASAIDLASYIKEKLKEFQGKANVYNVRENLFGKPRTDWSKISDLESELLPYYNLWIGIKTWRESSERWLNGPFSKLDGNEVDGTITDLNKNFKVALSRFKADNVDEKIFNMCLKYQTEVDKFRPKAELAVSLTRGLKDRHWKDIEKETKIDCTPRDGLTFNEIINKGMIKYVDFCADVGEKAYREAKIEEQLHQIEKKWKEIFFELTEHKLTKLPTISNWNDINKELDTDIMDVQQLDLSPFKGPFTALITQWNRDLLLIISVLEEWNKCQKSWIYLQPVFDSADIAKDIPYEHKKFKMTDRMWQDLMNGLNNNRNVKQCCSMEGLFEKLKEANMNLENVEKGLNDYMETKRSVFPRFYFISNAQFLEILSQTKDIKKVKDNVNKIFEPIDNIDLVEDKAIGAFISRLGEKLCFTENLQIIGYNVEVWMKKLEEKMFKTVRMYMENSVNDYDQRLRKDWVKNHPGQILMAVNQIKWTIEVEKCLNEGKLEQYMKTYNERILDIVSLVREKQTRVMSISLANLITMDVHNMNIKKNLLAKGISDTKAFEWIMQMRYYWEDIYDFNERKVQVNCIVKSVQTDFPYGYEYIGNAEILVITPLTDKCILTLMGALRLNLGGAPAGPAGTGKTETTKDLARSLGKLCIVYNCSDDTDYVMIGKFFKGLACCGAWICFDEFNRINIEVLSVIAQQLLTLFGAKDKNMTEIFFEGSQIKILPTFCVFITMNPGYAGRTELPDNLKALFRSISMMVPDYKLIAEINLYSSGYVQASELATKVVSTMKLSSEQLSTQGHYDFGMRAVKSVLNAARRLKRTELDKPEDQLLLRALEDVNVPKFVQEDIALFRNIISDLFPRTERPKIDYTDLLAKVDQVCLHPHFNLISSQAFKDKIIQLYDTLQVRHGLMIVGPAGGGKSSNYNVLKEAISQLADDQTYFKTQTQIINPKAVKHGELYSEQNVDTGEWTFGIVPIIINECKRDTSGKVKNWIIFDGPVDAMWIEDMNSVLDDSKKLCLASSDIILLNEMITIMFEVEDLIVASPATVSRCGMVYMEPSTLGVAPLYKCWIKKINELFNKTKNQITNKLNTLFERYLDESIRFIRKKVKEICPTVNNNLASSVMRIVDTFFDKFRTQEAQFKKMDDEIKQIDSVLEGIFYFACIWALGVTTNEEGRTKFNVFFRELIGKNILDQKFNLPAEGTVYDYLFDADKGVWVPWITLLGNLDIPNNAGYTEIIVPTPDSVRNSYVIKQLVKSNKHIITSGPTGTGKTINIMEVLGKGLGDKYMNIILNFSAQTTARQAQDTIQGKMQRRGRGRLAPEKPGMIFIDDMNMPVKQDSGAQPPIEILRQWLDHSGWYHLGTKSFIFIENIILLGAMGVPGGGRNYLSQRFQRHFNLITYNELDDTSIKMIFSKIVNFFLAKFPDEIKGCVDDIINITLKNYKEIKSTMLPTPAKMHYIFNLRDISKVLQGVSSITLGVAKERIDMGRIWVHEMTRVFGDRLINDEDRGILKQFLNKDVLGTLKEDEANLYKYGNKILFCDFMGADAYSKRNYNQITDVALFIKKINAFLETYNEDSKKKKLKLVMFLDACDHVARICRILRQPQGNALLLGVGGSGRQSLARLATFINSYACYQIDVIKGYEMRDFARNVKECLKLAGLTQNPQTFLIVDTQLVFSLMLEYINGILNTGDVPNLYEQADKDDILDKVKSEVLGKYGNLMESNVMKVYISRVQKNIHVVLAMSPLGNSFINRLRMFPSLVNCCTLDWFSEWPEDALESVAMDNFQQNDMGLSQETIPKIVNAFKYIHKRVEIESKVFSEQMRRHVYLTPTSYLELLNMYQKIYKRKTDEFKNNISRFENGLSVLKSANEEVEKMKEQIKIQQPLLEKNQEETKKLVEILTYEKAEAEKEKKDATEKEDEANIFEAECTKIFNHSQEEMDKVQPLINAAIESIKNVKPDDLQQQSKYNTLNEGCEKLFEGLLIFKLGDKWRKKEFLIKGDPQGKNPYNIKEAMFKCINFADYRGVLTDLGNYCNPENLDNLKVSPMLENIRSLNDYFIKANVDEKLIKRGAGSLVGLFKYLTLLIKYVDDSIRIIDPIKKDLAEATVKKENAIRVKETAIARKDAAQKKVDDLTETYEKTRKAEEELRKKVEDAKNKMYRAEQLINLLSGEQKRWSQSVKELKVQLTNLAGDSLMAAASICYNGPFIYSYRVALENDWRKKINNLQIIHSEGITMKTLLENPIEVNEWKVNGLPNDNLSIENGIIIQNTRRWPLLIDPQNQGSNYIKKYGKRLDKLNVIKASDPNFLNLIKSAIRLQRWVLLENVSTNLDPTLEPILNQQTISRGTTVEIKIGDDLIPWSNDFKLHLSTTIPNPHYSPETFVKVTIVNFGITPQGLQEQMMTLLINNEMPELEQRKNAILIENLLSITDLRKNEDRILNDLSKSEGGNISIFLETDEMINQLKESKTKSEEISQKIEESKETTIKIDKERERYRTAAERASILFFATLDLSSIDPMYQFSLQWFSKLYEYSIKTTPNSNNKETRIANLNKIFTRNLYENVCRSLFEKDKLLFSFVICHRIIIGEKGEKYITMDQWRYFLAGPTGDPPIPNNPTDWINKNEWAAFYRQLIFMSENFEETKGLEQFFMKKHFAFKKLFDSQNPQSDVMPDPWEEKTTEFLKLCLIKMVRPDKLINSLQLWIERNIGKEFIEPPPFELAKSYKQSSNIVPLIFILSPGSDPINDIKKFAEDQGYDKNKFDTVSLGRGQEMKAMKVLEDMRARGGWVLLQNCHLAQSFMGKLEEIVENFDTNWPDKDFRLWLTSMSNPFFPVSILQNSVKITVEPPKGLKNNLLRNYKKLEPKDLEEDCKKKDEYKALLFGLSFFHAIVQDRRKYGPIGWNVRYDFTNEDWMVSRKQIKIFLEEYQNIPYQVLDYLIGDINYGGRVTDDKDQRLIKTILHTYLHEDIFGYSKYKFSKSGIYYCPEPGEHDIYLTYIENLPVNSEPEVFGMHDNADIITAQNEGEALLNTVLGIQPRISSSSGKSQETIILELLAEIEKKTPKPFDKEEIFKQFPTDYNESLNTVLIQEVIRYNVLLTLMNKSIKTLNKGLTGRIVMSEETEEMAKSLFINIVPTVWSKVFLSQKPLSSWITDLNDRIKFFQDWIGSKKTPNTFWFSGFSFPQAFLTAALQNYARATKTAIDLLTFEFKILDKKKHTDITEKPEHGVYVYGMFLEGARWNFEKHILDDSMPKELYTDVPMIHFLPVANRDLPATGFYFCPLYKVLSRAGTLSTTGHSTNYILYVELPTDRPQSVWIKAGVAMFLSLKQ